MVWLGCLRTENGAIILEMRHRENYSGIKGKYKQRHQKQVQADKIRFPPKLSGVKLQTLNYIITATFGDRNLTVIVDTGSDLTRPTISSLAHPN
ncbi:hypothetical protein M9H77_29169 [Catharanthus roseus]|uniref:Uncharacterized protein n=1 Tax=Catharanthus roseus TaxID=4058 RepID=A0ACC0ALJ9_CATRO|nr:hypothetical protein M9H77_29169 [Catharanthus roseus]